MFLTFPPAPLCLKKHDVCIITNTMYYSHHRWSLNSLIREWESKGRLDFVYYNKSGGGVVVWPGGGSFVCPRPLYTSHCIDTRDFRPSVPLAFQPPGILYNNSNIVRVVSSLQTGKMDKRPIFFSFYCCSCFWRSKSFRRPFGKSGSEFPLCHPPPNNSATAPVQPFRLFLVNIFDPEKCFSFCNYKAQRL